MGSGGGGGGGGEKGCIVVYVKVSEYNMLNLLPLYLFDQTGFTIYYNIVQYTKNGHTPVSIKVALGFGH